ncbi:MAG: hypothetical protein C7B46_16975 [Sulfobacillus benefaciens]|uniref:Uncharacterized protein n=1 Tax=Sulfobacillus benefaciens TaxID=453960 RepID=A0A2T2XA92_9FIRM|nr:MAG: hypothetical protein C7B46_16975 [Sulfobacillus benefaciens]
MKISQHALQRWRVRAPREFNTPDDLQLALHTGRIIRETESTQWIAAMGMVIVVRNQVAVTCWKARAFSSRIS